MNRDKIWKIRKKSQSNSENDMAIMEERRVEQLNDSENIEEK